MFSFFTESLPIKKYTVLFAAAFIISLIALAIISIICAIFPPAQWLLSLIHSHYGSFSAFIAAFLCAMHCGKRGFLTGLLCADVYTLLLVSLGAIIFGGVVSLNVLTKTLFHASLAGIIGGIAGINCKK